MQPWTNRRVVVKWTMSLLLVVLIAGHLQTVLAQSWTTRDPRFYSREGVNDYFPPNPGDPDYRWVLLRDNLLLEETGVNDFCLILGPTHSTTDDMDIISLMDTGDNIRDRIQQISTRLGRH